MQKGRIASKLRQTSPEMQKSQFIKPYVFLKSVNPKLGKLSNPHESPIPLKNHLKQLQQKLMLKYFPSRRTWFLIDNKINLRYKNKRKVAT